MKACYWSLMTRLSMHCWKMNWCHHFNTESTWS